MGETESESKIGDLLRSRGDLHEDARARACVLRRRKGGGSGLDRVVLVFVEPGYDMLCIEREIMEETDSTQRCRGREISRFREISRESV